MSTLEMVANYILAAIYVAGALVALVVAAAIVAGILIVVTKEIARWMDRSKP